MKFRLHLARPKQKRSTVKIIIASVAAAIAVAVAIAIFSPKMAYVAKGTIRKIENAAQLKCALEILEEKNRDMQKSYVKMAVGESRIQKNLAVFKAKQAAAKSPEKAKIYADCVAKLEAAEAQMAKIKSSMKTNISKHRSNIDILAAKLQCLESLKSVNAYLSDVSINSGDGIQQLVDDTLTLETATFDALNELADIVETTPAE